MTVRHSLVLNGRKIMAIDTRDKRASILGYTGESAISYPVADSSLNAADREHVAGLYRGIAAALPGGGSGVTTVMQSGSTFRLIWGRTWGRVN